MAASRDYIKIDATQAAALQANLLKSYINTLRQAFDMGTRILSIMNHNNDGTIFTDVESLFGLPAGKGQIVFNLMNGSIGSMQGLFQVPDAKNITEQVG